MCPFIISEILPWFSFSSWTFLSLVTIFHSIFIFFLLCSFSFISSRLSFSSKTKHIRNTHKRVAYLPIFSSVCRWKNNKNKTQVGRRKWQGGGGWKTGKWWWKYRKKWNKFLLYNTFDRLYVVRIFML